MIHSITHIPTPIKESAIQIIQQNDLSDCDKLEKLADLGFTDDPMTFGHPDYSGEISFDGYELTLKNNIMNETPIFNIFCGLNPISHEPIHRPVYEWEILEYIGIPWSKMTQHERDEIEIIFSRT